MSLGSSVVLLGCVEIFSIFKLAGKLLAQLLAKLLLSRGHPAVSVWLFLMEEESCLFLFSGLGSYNFTSSMGGKYMTCAILIYR